MKGVNCLRNKHYMTAVKRHLELRGVPIFMCDATVGKSVGEQQLEGLRHAKGMVWFCTSDHGAHTWQETWRETLRQLQCMHYKGLPMFPIKLSEQWPPASENKQDTSQDQLVFDSGLVYIEDQKMQDAEGVADEIANAVSRLGLFSSDVLSDAPKGAVFPYVVVTLHGGPSCCCTLS